MTIVVDCIAHGAPVQLMEGPDHICAALRPVDRVRCAHDCQAPGIYARDRAAEATAEGLLRRDLRVARPLTDDDLQILRNGFLDSNNRGACEGCRWKPSCDEIARTGFEDTVLVERRIASVQEGTTP